MQLHDALKNVGFRQTRRQRQSNRRNGRPTPTSTSTLRTVPPSTPMQTAPTPTSTATAATMRTARQHLGLADSHKLRDTYPKNKAGVPIMPDGQMTRTAIGETYYGLDADGRVKFRKVEVTVRFVSY